jgi:hypothetical protein
VFRNRGSFHTLGRYLDWTALLVFLSFIGQAVITSVRTDRPEGVSAELLSQVPAKPAVPRPPDIVLLVLDSHTSIQALEKYWGHRHDSWVREMESKGFQVLTNARGNFAFTPYCMLALLNMDYPPEEIDVSGRQWNQTVHESLNNAQVIRLMEKWGYEFHNWSPFNVAERDRMFPTPWFRGFPQPGFSSLMGRTIVGFIRTPWNQSRSDTRLEAVWAHSQAILQRLRDFASEPPSAKPQFVYAHALLPHYPYLTQRDGSRREKDPGQHDSGAYLEQLLWLDEQVLEIVTALKVRASGPPIIVVQGDHGFRYLPGPDGPEEAVCLLNALYIPEGAADALYPTITPVNTFRVILNRCFNGRLPLREDRVRKPTKTGE